MNETNGARASLIKFALDLFGDTESAAFIVPIPNTTPPLFVAGGEREQIVALASAGAPQSSSGWERECADTDALLTALGLDPERCRTEGGSLQVAKVVSMLAASPAPAASKGSEAVPTPEQVASEALHATANSQVERTTSEPEAQKASVRDSLTDEQVTFAISFTQKDIEKLIEQRDELQQRLDAAEAQKAVAWEPEMRELIAKLRGGDWSLRSPDELACMIADMLERAIPRIAGRLGEGRG